MKDKSKKSTYSTTFGVDPNFLIVFANLIRGDFIKHHLSDSNRCLWNEVPRS